MSLTTLIQTLAGGWLPGATVAALAMFSCQSTPPCELPADTVAPYEKSTVRCHENGSLAKGKLLQATMIKGRLCQRWLHWNPDGSLDGCQLARDEVFTAGIIPKETILWFTSDGQLKTAWLDQDTVLEGHACRGGWGKVATGFHTNGKLASYYLRDDRVVNGVPCESSIMVPVTLFQEGPLRTCMLSREWTHRGETYPAGTKLRFDLQGQVVAAE